MTAPNGNKSPDDYTERDIDQLLQELWGDDSRVNYQTELPAVALDALHELPRLRIHDVFAKIIDADSRFSYFIGADDVPEAISQIFVRNVTAYLRQRYGEVLEAAHATARFIYSDMNGISPEDVPIAHDMKRFEGYFLALPQQWKQTLGLIGSSLRTMEGLEPSAFQDDVSFINDSTLADRVVELSKQMELPVRDVLSYSMYYSQVVSPRASSFRSKELKKFASQHSKKVVTDTTFYTAPGVFSSQSHTPEEAPVLAVAVRGKSWERISQKEMMYWLFLCVQEELQHALSHTEGPSLMTVQRSFTVMQSANKAQIRAAVKHLPSRTDLDQSLVDQICYYVMSNPVMASTDAIGIGLYVKSKKVEDELLDDLRGNIKDNINLLSSSLRSLKGQLLYRRLLESSRHICIDSGPLQGHYVIRVEDKRHMPRYGHIKAWVGLPSNEDSLYNDAVYEILVLGTNCLKVNYIDQETRHVAHEQRRNTLHEQLVKTITHYPIYYDVMRKICPDVNILPASLRYPMLDDLVALSQQSP